MALGSYAGIKAEIADWIPRATGAITTQVDTWIDLFEAYANRNIRVSQMEAEANAPASEFLDFPDDFLELRDIQYQGNPRTQLKYVTPEYADEYDRSGTTGTPKFYTIVGNQIRLVPAPDATTNVRISYWQTIPALSDSQTTNWLLTAYPDAYLYGSLLHARAWMNDPQQAAMIADGFKQVMFEIQSAGRRRNLGGSLAVRPA